MSPKSDTVDLFGLELSSAASMKFVINKTRKHHYTLNIIPNTKNDKSERNSLKFIYSGILFFSYISKVQKEL